MTSDFSQNIDYFLRSDLKDLIKGTYCGLELETLRVNQKGSISLAPHPKELGSPLFNPLITKDFAEAQIEYTTPKCKSHQKAIRYLEELLAYTTKHMGKEFLWPLAMPPVCDHLNSSLIAQFGSTEEARKKHLYRLGLMHRYGTHVQLIAGLHYNFSFPKAFFIADYHKHSQSLSLQDFISERYLHIMRNFTRYTYLLVYLLGASPTHDTSYPSIRKRYPFATSLRMSPFGYHSPFQCSLGVSYNSLKAFFSSFEKELSTPCKRFGSIEEQLNDHILQTESELYVPIRAKGNIDCESATLLAIKRCGISYLEVRTLDLNPFEMAKVQKKDLDFLRLFLIYCLIKPSPQQSHQDVLEARYNQHHIALYGRKPHVRLKNKKSFKKEALKILSEMLTIAKILKQESCVWTQIAKINDSSLCYSEQIASKPFLEFGLQQAKNHQTFFQNYPLKTSRYHTLSLIAQKSLLKQQRADAKARFHLKGYEDLEKSTQALIREALFRKLSVEVLDPKENFISITKGSHKEYIKEATKTARDSYMTALIMEHKAISKKILNDNHLSTPKGLFFTDLPSALEAYTNFQNAKCVIKPNTTNFGIGVHIINAHEPLLYQRYVKDAFTYSSGVVIEHFQKGEEYRFLVIDHKVIGVVQRIPANVTGDGKKSIRALVKQKNKDPLSYKDQKTRIQLGEKEKKCLAEQNLTLNTVLPKGRQVFLRHNSNISTGGDAIDRTDEVHQGYCLLAIKAAKAAQAMICGVDIIIEKIDQTPHPSNYSIIEINYNPMLALHEFPIKGKPRNTAKPLLDFLGF